jgi:hypothetical protein
VTDEEAVCVSALATIGGKGEALEPLRERAPVPLPLPDDDAVDDVDDEGNITTRGLRKKERRGERN